MNERRGGQVIEVARSIKASGCLPVSGRLAGSRAKKKSSQAGPSEKAAFPVSIAQEPHIRYDFQTKE